MHLTEDDLILHYYGEQPEQGDGAIHLGSCEVCRSRLAVLQRVLNSMDTLPVPERDPAYGARVWQRLEPQIVRPWWHYKSWKSWLLGDLRTRQKIFVAAAVTCAMLIAFFAGRYSPRPDASPVAQGQVRERVLLVALGHHLERSQMILVEIANAPDDASLNIAGERAMAETLVEANRLYRQTALATGQNAAASVLDDLERILLEVAHSPDQLDAEDLAELQKRIEEQGLLFKVRVFGSQLRESPGSLPKAASQAPAQPI
jgi:hypothetical protein